MSTADFVFPPFPVCFTFIPGFLNIFRFLLCFAFITCLFSGFSGGFCFVLCFLFVYRLSPAFSDGFRFFSVSCLPSVYLSFFARFFCFPIAFRPFPARSLFSLLVSFCFCLFSSASPFCFLPFSRSAFVFTRPFCVDFLSVFHFLLRSWKLTFFIQ